jgi:hypothetical protein
MEVTTQNATHVAEHIIRHIQRSKSPKPKKYIVPPEILIPNAVPIPIEGGTPQVQWVRITPPVAWKFLDEGDFKNRTVREDKVKTMAEAMRTGRWCGFNGETMKIDARGRFVDGQHRCWACIEANVPFDTLLVIGVPVDSYTTQGIGLPKSFADFLKEDKNKHQVAAVTRLVYLWEKDNLHGVRTGVGSTPQMLDEILTRHPKIRDSVNKIMSISGMIACGANRSWSSFVHYVGATHHHNSALADEFFERLADGVNLFEDSPVYGLRRFLAIQKAKKQNHRAMLPPFISFALYIKAWNYYREGKKIRNLKFSADEPFPKL